MPFKDFTVGEVLSSADVDLYLMSQVIIRCTSGTRPSSPAQGWHIYETDTQRFMVYNGSTWIDEGGGYWQPIQRTNVLAASPVSSVSFPSIDTNFRMFRLTVMGAPAGSLFRLQFNGDTGNNYSAELTAMDGAGVSALRETPTDKIHLAASGSFEYHVGEYVIAKPAASIPAYVSGHAGHRSPIRSSIVGGIWNNTSALISSLTIGSLGTFSGFFALEGMKLS